MNTTATVDPASHEEALERVMRVIDVIAARPDITDEDAVAALTRDGIAVVDAELMIRFVCPTRKF